MLIKIGIGVSLLKVSEKANLLFFPLFEILMRASHHKIVYQVKFISLFERKNENN